MHALPLSDVRSSFLFTGKTSVALINRFIFDEAVSINSQPKAFLPHTDPSSYLIDMYLLRVIDGHFTLDRFPGTNKPPYAILSHRWEDDDEEVNYQDIRSGTGHGKKGFEKLQFCSNQAARDGLTYFWVDTCCIDKTNSSELSEAIVSMFKWYQRAERCYVYLSDVSSDGREMAQLQRWNLAFRRSKWFTRGWTLQELIAPKSVEFFSKERHLLGNKHDMLEQVSDATGIPREAITGKPLFQFSFDERISWMTHRHTQRPEDRAYSLSGLLDICLMPQYGEEYDNAMKRLEDEFFSVRCFPGRTKANFSKNRKPSKGAQQMNRPDRFSQKRPLCRSYEPLVLLYTLGSTDEDYIHTMLPTEEDTLYLPPKTTMRKFLEDIAYVCDYDIGHDTVTAIGMQSSSQKNILWIASNSPPARQIISFVNARLNDVKQISTAVGIDQRTRTEKFIETCVEFAAPQIEDEMSRLLAAFQRCKTYLEEHHQDEGESIHNYCSLFDRRSVHYSHSPISFQACPVDGSLRLAANTHGFLSLSL